MHVQVAEAIVLQIPVEWCPPRTVSDDESSAPPDSVLVLVLHEPQGG
jgi:hypothetical protein